MLFMQVAEFINTFLTSLPAPIPKFLTFQWAILRHKFYRRNHHDTVDKRLLEQQFCKSNMITFVV